MKACFACGKSIDTSQKPGRRDACPSCGADMKACLNCRFYDRASSNKCRETRAELVTDKDRANFCEYFAFASDENNKSAAGGDPLKKLKDLFK